MASKREELIRAAIKGVRQYGLDGLRTQHITKLAGVSAGNLYTHFTSKEELLRVCFEEVDKQIAALFNGLRFTPDQIQNNSTEMVFVLWGRYFQWLINHPDETIFYFAYRTTPSFPAYEKSRDASHFADFVQIFSDIDQQYHMYSHIPAQILWTHILTVTQLYAKLVIEGIIPADNASIQSIFQIIMGGLRVALPQPKATGE